MQNSLSDIVFKYMNRRCVNLFDSEEKYHMIAGSVLGQIWGARIEYDKESKNGKKDHHATYRIHVPSPEIIKELCEIADIPIPSKYSQIGGRLLIDEIWDRTRAHGFNNEPLPTDYGNIRINRFGKSPRDFFIALGVDEKVWPYFIKSCRCLPILHNYEVSDSKETKDLLPIDEKRAYNECIRDGEKYLYKKPLTDFEKSHYIQEQTKYKFEESSEFKSKCEEIRNGGYCLTRDGCSNYTNDLTGHGFPVYFTTKTNEFSLLERMYSYDYNVLKSLIRSSCYIEFTMTVEHLLSRHEAYHLKINPNFLGNIFGACSSCNSSLGHLPFLSKIDKIYRLNQKNDSIIKPLCDSVINGLKKNEHTEVAIKFETELRRKYGFYK